MPNEKNCVTVSLKPEIYDMVEQCSKRMGLSRAQFVRNLIYVALDDVKMLDRFGLLDFAMWLNNFRTALKQMTYEVETKKAR